MKRRRGRLRRRLSPALARRTLRRAWRGARHGARRLVMRSRRPALLFAALVAVSSVIGVGAFTADAFYAEYGTPRTAANVLAWAARSPSYLASDCRGCHGTQASALTRAEHQDLVCETCHAPVPGHPGTVAGVTVRQPSGQDESCVACHAATEARPASFSGVALDRHYVGAECLRCHEPHAGEAVTPREVTHPLDRLPACTTCHAPDGLKRFPANHQAESDSVCLACHRIGAGTDD